ncbi:uncharacterized protein PAF06_012678 [Gastrophryne carolinensis]
MWGFNERNFSIAVLCERVEDLQRALKEVPPETDWLCVIIYSGVKEAGAFSQFSNLKSLYITGDVDLLPGVFNGLNQLSTLWIESQTNNMTVHEGTFDGLNSLKELKISQVPLSTFNLSILSHLHLLDHLILDNNNITRLSEVTASLGIFQNLQKLSVNSNDIKELRNDDCVTTWYGESIQFVDFNISYLDLRGNPLDLIQNNSLCNFPHLEVFEAYNILNPAVLIESGIKTIKTLLLFYGTKKNLDICNITSFFHTKELKIFNLLHSLNAYVGSCQQLQKLDLTGNSLQQVTVSDILRLHYLLKLDLSLNQIEHFTICTNESVPAMKLIYLNVSYNYLTGLQKEQFICLKDLQILSLENNRINYIDQTAFNGLDQLRVLNLQNNNIFAIDNIIFSHLFSLEHLNLYENILLDLDNYAFSNLTHLQDISLTKNQVTFIYTLIFAQGSLRHISMKTDSLLWVGDFLGNFTSLESFEVDSYFIDIRCTQYIQLKELHLRNFEYFQCDEDNEENSIPIFTNLEKIYYTGSSDDNFYSKFSGILKNLTSLKFLYLQDTDKMVRFNHLNVSEMFQGLSHLRVLHLKNSGIENWDSKDITMDFPELEFLFIENQRIEQFSVTVFDSMPNLKYIYFWQTVFPCSCEFSELLTWLESGTKVSIINFHQQKCQLKKNSTNLISFLQRSCNTNLDLTMFLVTFNFTLMFMCISFFYESICWYILYIVYTLKYWLNHRQQDIGQYPFDVFVSYNKHDQLWVFQELLPNLELNGPPFFKVCIHDRDFEIGRDILDNISESICKSRWTVCVISHNFLQSNWCSLEMRMAIYRLLDESKDSLILIFIEKITREELQYHHRLTKLMNKKTYLDWPEDEKGQQLFWARLRKALA